MDISNQDALNGKLTPLQETMCQEGNIRGVFGYPTKTQELARKYRTNVHTIDDMICQFGTIENYIKQRREDGAKEKRINLVIDVSSEEQKKEKALLWEKIFGDAYSNEGLLLVDGEKVLEQLDTIPERYAEVIRYRIGLINGRIYTLDELGEMFGVTQERIRQIENKSMRILRRYHNNRCVVYSESDTNGQKFTPEDAVRRKLLLDRIYDSNLIWIPDKEYEQEPDSMQRSELGEIVEELKSIQPITERQENSTKNKMPKNQTLENTSISILGLSIRTYMILKSAGITTIEQLRVTSTEELMAIRAMGEKTIEEIDEKLKELGIERNTPQSTIVVDTSNVLDSEASISVLNFSARTNNVLNRAGITTIGQLRGTTTKELMKLRSAGRKAVEEIISKLKELEIEGASEERTTVLEETDTETTELGKARAKRDELAIEAEKLKEQTKSAEQLLASYDALIKGNIKEDGITLDLDEE